jgi:hypothetical protein
MVKQYLRGPAFWAFLFASLLYALIAISSRQRSTFPIFVWSFGFGVPIALRINNPNKNGKSLSKLSIAGVVGGICLTIVGYQIALPIFAYLITFAGFMTFFLVFFPIHDTVISSKSSLNGS